MTEDRRKSDRRVSPAIGEFALQERGELLAQIVFLKSVEKERNALRAELAALKAQQPSTGVTYLECRQCDICQHAGINDSADRKAACHSCDWSGDSPVEDVCPGCGSHNVMAAACPDCGGRYVFIASHELPTATDQPPGGVVLPEPFEMRPFQTVDQGSTNYKAGFNAALRKVRERLNSPTISDGCDTCHGQGEVWSGETAYQGHFQPPEPIMDVCPECSGESVPTVSAGVTLPDDFVCGSKPLQDLLNATAMLLETPSHDSATYWAAQLANVEALLKPVIAGVVDERAAFEAWWKSYPLGDLVDPSDQAHRHIGLKIWQARAAQPDHSELNLVMATVPRELLKRVVGADASMGANAFQLADGWKAMDELRALLAQHEGDKS